MEFSVSQFGRLPQELLETVFFNLDAKSRFALLSASKQLAGVASGFCWRDADELEVQLRIDTDRDVAASHARMEMMVAHSLSVDDEDDGAVFSGARFRRASGSGAGRLRRSMLGRPSVLPTPFVFALGRGRALEPPPPLPPPPPPPPPPIDVDPEEGSDKAKLLGNTAAVVLRTVDPRDGARHVLKDEIRSAKVCRFVRWTGSSLRSLHLGVTPLACVDGADARGRRAIPTTSTLFRRSRCAVGDVLLRVLDEMARDGVCPHLQDLQLSSCLLMSRARILRSLAHLLSVRNMHGGAAADAVSPIQSLALKIEPGCALPSYQIEMSCLEMHVGSAERFRACSATSRDAMDVEELKRLAALMRGDDDDGDGDTGCVLNPDYLARLLQQLLDCAANLQTLDIDQVVERAQLALTDLRYPSSLLELKSERLAAGAAVGVSPLAHVALHCPALRVVRVDCTLGAARGCFAPLRSLAALRRIELVRLGDSFAFAEAVFGAVSSAQSSPWTHLQALTLRSCSSVDTVFVNSLVNLCAGLQELNVIGSTLDHINGHMLMRICQLSALRSLVLSDGAVVATAAASLDAVFSDAALDCLADHCPNLETLQTSSGNVHPLSVPGFVRACRQLRLASFGLCIRLNSLDAVVMLRSLAVDMVERQVRTEIQVAELEGGSYDSLDRITAGLPAELLFAHSDLSQYCPHDRLDCAACCFGAAAANRRALVVGRQSLPNALLVFCCAVAPPALA